MDNLYECENEDVTEIDIFENYMIEEEFDDI